MLGAYTGVARINLKISDEDGDLKKNTTGWLTGAKLGGIYEIDANNEIEFGYKLEYAKYSTIHIDDDVHAKAKELSHGLFVGYNYKF
ncbi:MAG: hypothetical protein LUC34_03700 [Campylobacter sp.]|nr:hypothetical protein [Campylobacter sp.]